LINIPFFSYNNLIQLENREEFDFDFDFELFIHKSNHLI